jgi:Gpi18-like mannosyltransferase
LRNTERKRRVLFVGLFLLLNKILIFIPAFIADEKRFPNEPPIKFLKILFFDTFFKWDSGWYSKIALNGYDLKSTAFFPLYPIILMLFNKIGHISPVYAGVILSNILFIFILIFFMALVRLDYNEKDVYKITLLFTVFPTSYYFSCAYTESLYMLLTLVSLYAIRKQQWAKASIAGMFAGVTRNTGVLLSIPFAIEFLFCYWKDKDRKLIFDWGKLKHILWGLFFPLLTFCYMGFLYYRFNDPFAFAHAQKLFFRSFMYPWETIYHGLYDVAHRLKDLHINKVDLYYIIELCAVLLVLYVLVFSFKKIRLSYWVILLYSFLIPLSAPAFAAKDYFISFTRYSLVIFPLYLGLYEVFKNKVLYYLLIVSFSGVFIFLVYMWSMHKFVA